MTKPQTEADSGQSKSSGSVFERVGQAEIAGERRRQERMTPVQRLRDRSARRILMGILSAVCALATLAVIVGYLVTDPASRMPIVLILVFAVAVTVVQMRRGK